MSYIDHVGRAEIYEARGTWHDWLNAAECWYRAAASLQGNPHNLRTYYAQREDAAKARASELMAQGEGFNSCSNAK